MARIERATSPLPRECSTTEPHGHRHRSGRITNHTYTDRQSITTRSRQPEPHHPTLERETGIEPAPSAWKAEVLPLNYSRPSETGGAWWRGLDSNQRRRKPTDLQSAPFSHSGTSPGKIRLSPGFWRLSNAKPHPPGVHDGRERRKGTTPQRHRRRRQSKSIGFAG